MVTNGAKYWILRTITCQLAEETDGRASFKIFVFDFGYLGFTGLLNLWNFFELEFANRASIWVVYSPFLYALEAELVVAAIDCCLRSWKRFFHTNHTVDIWFPFRVARRIGFFRKLWLKLIDHHRFPCPLTWLWLRFLGVLLRILNETRPKDVLILLRTFFWLFLPHFPIIIWFTIIQIFLVPWDHDLLFPFH